MARLLTEGFVPARCSLVRGTTGWDALGEALVRGQAQPGLPGAFPPDLLVFDAEQRLLGRLRFDADAAQTFTFLQGLRAAHPARTGGAGLPPPTQATLPPPADPELAALEAAHAAGDRETLAVPLDRWLVAHPTLDDAGLLARLLRASVAWHAGEPARAEALWREVAAQPHPLRHRAAYNLLDPETWPTRTHPDVGAARPPRDLPPLVPHPARHAQALARMASDPAVWTPLPGLPLVQVPAGRFVMGGQPARLPRELPLRHVTLSRPFWIGAVVLTRLALAALWPERGPAPSPAEAWLPATGLSWLEAVELCARLGRRLGRPARLPTEAEWEYAARGGVAGAEHPWGPEPPDEDRCSSALPRPGVVACYPPNAWGLYDVVGNTQEWTADRFLDEAYALTPAEVVDPPGPSALQAPLPQRAVRGGLCGAPMTAVMNRLAFRVGTFEGYRAGSMGFRVVVERG